MTSENLENFEKSRHGLLAPFLHDKIFVLRSLLADKSEKQREDIQENEKCLLDKF